MMTLEDVRDGLRKLSRGRIDYVELRAMADAIDAHLTSREAKGEPVAWQYRNVFCNEKSHKWHSIHKAQFDAWKANNDPSIELRELVVAQPAAQEAAKPVVPEELEDNSGFAGSDDRERGYIEGWNDCRKAMISAVQEGN